ncbi:stress-responsive transcription factor hsf1 [Podila epigama]|nr:stress-responsive transcription factor hsf1 [Podila epigama]
MDNHHPRIVELPNNSRGVPIDSFAQDLINRGNSHTNSPIVTTPDSQDALASILASSVGSTGYNGSPMTPPSSTPSLSSASTTPTITDLMSPETRSALALINASHTANSIAAARSSNSTMSPLTGLASSSLSFPTQVAGNTTTVGANRSGAVAGTPTAPSLPSPSSSTSSSTKALQPRSANNSGRGSVAAFLTKLYNMVGDKASNNLIKWSDDGQSFLVLKHVEFAKEVLPKFFKHNNFSSFVRQLNMYGFHKVPHLQQGVLMPDADSEQWEFSNPHFQKNQPDLLYLVSRKKASNGAEDKDALTMDLGHILSEVTAIKRHQVAISSDLKNIERDHQSLWQESIAARERHHRQQETIDKILRFLASVFSGEKKRAIVPNKKPRLTITEGLQKKHNKQRTTVSGGMSDVILEDGDDYEGMEEEEEVEESENEEILNRSNSTFQQGDLAETVSQLLTTTSTGTNNGKRNHSVMTAGSDVGISPDFILPNTLSTVSEITPASLSTLHGTTSNTAASTAPAKKTATSEKATKGKTSALTNKSGNSPSATNPNSNNNNNSSVNAIGGLSTIATTSSAATLPSVPSPTLPLDYLNNFSGLGNFLSQQPNSSLRLDPSLLANLSIPTSLLPPNSNVNSTTYYETLRDIANANAYANLVTPLPPPLFNQTPAGQSVIKGVDQITKEMEQLEKSIEALEQHGLNVNELNFEEDDAFMPLNDQYGDSDFNSGGQYDFNAVTGSPNSTTNGAGASDTVSSIMSSPSVGADSRISTTGQEEYLEGLLNLDPIDTQIQTNKE